MGWERKRGKIEEFNRLLRGATDTSFAVQVGDLSILPQVRYCITLDSDTRLPRDAARAADRHHHAPAESAHVRSRRSAASPKATASCSRASASRSRAPPARCSRGCIRATPASIPYTTAVSDTYQDLFGEGIFTGKGLYDVDAFMAALEDSRPRERAAVARSVRGAPRARRARLGRGARRRISVERAHARPAPAPLDSRRLADSVLAVSVRPVALRAEAQHAAAHRPLEDPRQPAPQPRHADAARAARRRLDGAAGLALVLDDDGGRRSSRRSCCRSSRACSAGPARRSRFRSSSATCATTRRPRWRRSLLSVTFLAYHAFETAHAIGLTLVRLVVTKRRLLEWETAAAAAARGDRARRPQGRASVRGRHDVEPGDRRRRRAGDRGPRPRRARRRGAVPAAVGRRARRRLLAQRAGRPARAAAHGERADAAAADGAQDVALLRNVRDGSRRAGCRPTTIRKRATSPALARRTSPTNIGMSLLSTLAAHDLGYLSTETLVRRLDLTLTTLEGLERYQGHFLNWYDTSTLAPLHPAIRLDRRQRQPGRRR